MSIMNHPEQHIPISISLEKETVPRDIAPKLGADKKRLVFISLLAIAIGVCVSVIAKLLVYLIQFITNVSFHQQFSFGPASPAGHHLGWWVILVPAAGGVVVGLMILICAIRDQNPCILCAN